MSDERKTSTENERSMYDWNDRILELAKLVGNDIRVREDSERRENAAYLDSSS